MRSPTNLGRGAAERFLALDGDEQTVDDLMAIGQARRGMLRTPAVMPLPAFKQSLANARMEIGLVVESRPTRVMVELSVTELARTFRRYGMSPVLLVQRNRLEYGLGHGLFLPTAFVRPKSEASGDAPPLLWGPEPMTG